jgi:hypothetical protein
MTTERHVGPLLVRIAVSGIRSLTGVQHLLGRVDRNADALRGVLFANVAGTHGL